MDDDDDEDDDERDDDSDSSGYVLRQTVIRKAWDKLFDSNDHLLFCSRNASVDLSPLHPSQVHIFKLWQIYLDNINPLLKVTHTPSLQGRIIDAAGDVTNIKPSLEALMFSIYCAAVFSITQAECQKLFGSQREDVLASYQLGAREALLNAGFLKSGDRDCLTALHLYLVCFLVYLLQLGCALPTCESDLLDLKVRFLGHAKAQASNDHNTHELVLTIAAYRQTSNRSSITVIDTGCSNAHCSAYGHS
jgi:hypothetical protein